MMFYIWHTLIVLLFIAFSFYLGYRYGKKTKEYKITYTEEKVKSKCPMGFNWYGWRNNNIGSIY